MSKKKLRNRLDSLFADLEQEASFLPSSSEPPLPGWMWECDIEGVYTDCSPEVEEILGISPQDFLGQSIETFALHSRSTGLVKSTLSDDHFPVEINVHFETVNGELISAVLHALKDLPEDGTEGKLRGFVRILEPRRPPEHPEPPITPVKEKAPPSRLIPQAPIQPSFSREVIPPFQPETTSAQEDWLQPSASPLSKAGLESLERRELVVKRANVDTPAAMAIPVQLPEQSLGLLEILDDTPDRYWNPDECRLIEQVADQLSLALENAHLFQSEQRRANELNTLVQLSRLISENLELEEVYQTAHHIISQLMPADYFSINLLDRQKNEFTTAYQVDKGTRMPVSRFPGSVGFSGYVVKTGNPYIVYDMEVETIPFQRVRTPGSESEVRSLITVPLLFSGEPIGALTSQSYAPNAFSEYDLQLLQTYADHIGIAIQNARLLEQTQARAEELSILHEVSLELAQEQRDLNTVLEIIVRRAMTLLDADGGGIWLWQENTKDLELVASFHFDEGQWIAPRVKPGEELVGMAYSDGKIRVIDDYLALSPKTEGGQEIPFSSGMAVPLVWQSRGVGVLTVTRSQPGNPFSSGEQSLAELLGSQATAVIQNARLYQQEQHRRQVADTLREIARALGATLDLKEVIERMLDQVGNLIEFTTASIQLIQKGRRQIIGGRGLEFESTTQSSSTLWRPISDDALISEVVQSRKPLFIEDTHTDPRWDIRPENLHIRAWITAPLIAAQEVVGLMTLEHTSPGMYEEEAAEMASAVAAQAAIAIQNARLFQQSQETLAETETLYLASAELNTAQSYEEVLAALRRHTLAGQDSHIVSLCFFNRAWTKEQKPEWVEVLASWELDPDTDFESRFLLSSFPSFPQLLHPDAPLLIEDVLHDPRLDENLRALLGKHFGAKSSLFMSIVVSGQWLGFINAVYPKEMSFPESDIRRMAALVNQAGVALQNLRNIEVAEQRAIESQKRSEELTMINRVVTAVVSSPDIHQVLDTMATELVDVFSVNNVDIALLEEQQNALLVVAAKSSLPTVPSIEGMVMPIQANLSSQEVIIKKRPLLVTDAQNSELTSSMHSMLRERGVENMLMVPIIAAGEVVGVVSLGVSEKQRTFTPEELRLAETLIAQLSTAIQNANLFDQIQSALAETETLYQASAELNAAQSYADILSILRKYSILGHKDTTNVTINHFDRPWVKDEVPDSYMPIARWANSPYMDIPATRFPMRTWTTVKQVLRPDSPTLITDTVNDPRIDLTARSLYVERLEAKSLLFAPLNVGGEWFGHINAVYAQPVKFSETEIRRLMALASQAGVAIQNIRLLVETRRRASQLETAAEIARDTSGTLALDTLLKRAVNLIHDRYGYYHSSIFLLDDSGLNAIIRESTGEAGDEMKRRAHKLPVGSRSIIGYVTELGKPLVINDVTQDPIHRPNPLLPDTRSELGIPLKIGNRVIGALDVQSAEINAFNPDDISVVQTLADQIAVAVDNARSYELAQQAIQETRQRVQELSTLFDVSQSLASVSMESAEIAHIIAQKVADVMNVPGCSILLFESETDELVRLVELSKSRENVGDKELHFTDRSGEIIPVSSYLDLSKVIKTLTPLVVQASDPNIDQEILEYLQKHDYTHLIVIPLIVKREVIGVIELVTWQAVYTYSSDQFNLTVTIGNAAAVAFENARLYEEQRRITEKLREVDKLKSQFLANMSHELRTPLNSIIGFSRVILKGIDGPINELQQQDLTAIHNSGTHLLRLINNVLDISKIEAGKMELAFDDTVNLQDLINSVISTTIALVKDKPVRLEKVIPPDLPTVRGDPTRISQVMLNLMANAAKFTDEGTVTLEACEQVSPEGYPEVLIKVTDTGEGIGLEDQKKLFQPFSQVDESPTRKTGGSGLGLSISRLLVEMHGGRIGVESEIGEGSTFWFTLPLPYDEPFDEELTGKKVILAIDDERQVINLYTRYLSEHGYQVVALSEPGRAIERAIQVKPFAITLDVMMPGRNGWQVLEELKSNPDTRHIPVIVCSIVEDQEKGFSLGAADYLTKPILEDELVIALNRLNGDGSIKEVLVVDDDNDDLRLVEKVLQKQFSVRLAHGGVEGLAALREKRPSAVILDLFMPDVDGFTLLEDMRADPAMRDIPVIIFTAGDLSEEQQTRLAEFSQEMLHKSSFEEEEMLAAIKNTLMRFSAQAPADSDE